MGFSRHEYWSGLPFSSPGDLPDPGIEPAPPALERHGSFLFRSLWQGDDFQSMLYSPDPLCREKFNMGEPAPLIFCLLYHCCNMWIKTWFLFSVWLIALTDYHYTWLHDRHSGQGVQLHKMSFWKSKKPGGLTGHFASHTMYLSRRVLEDGIQKRFGSEQYHWFFSLAPDFLAELTQWVKLEIQPRGSKKTRKAFL